MPFNRSRLAARIAVPAGVLVLVAGGLSACGGSSSSGNSNSSASSSASASDSSTTASAQSASGPARIDVTLTSDGGGSCQLSATKAKAGPVTFTVTNKSASAITEVELQSDNRIIGEKENLAPGLPTVSFTSTLGGGAYQIYCPGASKEIQTFTVTGKAAAQPGGSTEVLLKQGTKGYSTYVNGVVGSMVTAVHRLNTDIQAGNLAAAKREYPLARPFYERIESDVDGFVLPGFKATDNAGNLDYLIDMRASNLDPKAGWHGFHALERDLFQRDKISAQTKQLSAELVKNVKTLQKVTSGLKYKPEDLANGAADLLEEVQTTKITGEEEAFSHYDLVDFAGNVEGAQQAFAYLEPGLKKIDPTLTAEINAQFAKVNKLLNSYRDDSVPGGYVLYTAKIKKRDGPKLSRAVQALQQPLSTIAAKVATA
jgi:iron uptake system component EfeO